MWSCIWPSLGDDQRNSIFMVIFGFYHRFWRWWSFKMGLVEHASSTGPILHIFSALDCAYILCWADNREFSSSADGCKETTNAGKKETTEIVLNNQNWIFYADSGKHDKYTTTKRKEKSHTAQSILINITCSEILTHKNCIINDAGERKNSNFSFFFETFYIDQIQCGREKDESFEFNVEWCWKIDDEK